MRGKEPPSQFPFHIHNLLILCNFIYIKSVNNLTFGGANNERFNVIL